MNPTPEDRIAAIEKRLRRTQWTLRFLSYATLLLIAYAAYGTRELLRERALVIDRHGNLQLLADGGIDARVLVYKGDASSGIKLYDIANEQRATLATSGEGSALDLRDANAHMRIMARVSQDGPQLLMADANKNVRVSLNVLQGQPRMQFFDAGGRVTFDTMELMSPAGPVAATPVSAAPPAQAAAPAAPAP